MGNSSSDSNNRSGIPLAGTARDRSGYTVITVGFENAKNKLQPISSQNNQNSIGK